jgi:peptidoglycan/LPS O-acetylase OafA/YrhL
LNALIATVGLLRSPRRMVLAWAVGAVVLVGAVVAFNSLAAERWVGLSENAGMTFFQGQCDVAYVSGGPSTRPFYFKLTGPAQLHRGRSFAFPDCIKADGLGHAGLLVRHVADMAATTVPWPEYDDGGAVRRVADASNRLMAAWLVLLGVLGLVARWRRIVFPRAALVPAAHLACAVVVAIVFLGDPRLRLLYEPFALTLLAAFLVGLVRQVRGDRRT